MADADGLVPPAVRPTAQGKKLLPPGGVSKLGGVFEFKNSQLVAYKKTEARETLNLTSQNTGSWQRCTYDDSRLRGEGMGSRYASPSRDQVDFLDRLLATTTTTRLRDPIASRDEHQPPPPELLACRASA